MKRFLFIILSFSALANCGDTSGNESDGGATWYQVRTERLINLEEAELEAFRQTGPDFWKQVGLGKADIKGAARAAVPIGAEDRLSFIHKATSGGVVRFQNKMTPRIASAALAASELRPLDLGNPYKYEVKKADAREKLGLNGAIKIRRRSGGGKTLWGKPETGKMLEFESSMVGDTVHRVSELSRYISDTREAMAAVSRKREAVEYPHTLAQLPCGHVEHRDCLQPCRGVCPEWGCSEKFNRRDLLDATVVKEGAKGGVCLEELKVAGAFVGGASAEPRSNGKSGRSGTGGHDKARPRKSRRRHP